jgi:hypothetical protein
VRIFSTRWFARYARKEGISDDSLREAIERAGRGLVDANLGGHLIKQRVARQGRGRSGGYRVLIAFSAGRRSVFLYGFAKNERGNIDPVELADLKFLAERLLNFTASEMETALRQGELNEVASDGSEEKK